MLSLVVVISACSGSGSDPAPTATETGSTGVDAGGTTAGNDGGITAGGLDDGSTAGDTSGDAGESGAGNATGDGGSETNVSSSGDYDLSQYQFHKNVLTAGGQISFVEKIYGKQDASEDGAFFSITREFVNNGASIDELSDGKVIKRFVINSTSIEETLLDPIDVRVTQRFANVGDVFLNANSTPPAGSAFPVIQNATCTLQEHLDTFDLSTATGDITLASGVYQDVLKVECITSFVSGATLTPHSTLRNYFAKDFGVIFNEGNIILFDDVYIIEEY